MPNRFNFSPHPSFPRKRESREPSYRALSLDPRFRGGDEYEKSRAYICR
jgi:hypothetical protein